MLCFTVIGKLTDFTGFMFCVELFVSHWHTLHFKRCRHFLCGNLIGDVFFKEFVYPCFLKPKFKIADG